MKSTLVSFKEVSLKLGTKEILQKISFTLYKGDFITVIGPNGAGKSSLLKLLIKSAAPTNGEISWHEAPRIGYVPQRLHLSSAMPLRVSDFLNLRAYTPECEERIDKLSSDLNIQHLAPQQMKELSGGELQKVLLCYALAIDPGLLILDEPLAGVDINSQRAITNYLVRLNKEEGVTIIMVSHDLNLVMAQSSYVICLEKHICCSGTASQIQNTEAYQNLAGNIALYTHKSEEHK